MALRTGTTAASASSPGPARKNSGGFAILEARPAARTGPPKNFSRPKPSLSGLDPARFRWGSPFIERRSGVVRKERGQEHKEQENEQRNHHHRQPDREPEIRYTKEGQATQLGVAVNRRWQDKSTQEWQESTSFFDVICWRDLAETWPSPSPRGCG